MKLIDDLLNRITMYRLTLYYLIFLLAAAAVLSLFGQIKFNFFSIVLSSIFLVVVCLIVNKIFAWAFEIPANIESPYITALILALIISPAQSVSDYSILFWSGALAMAVKFILVIKKKHLFNPAAATAGIMALALNQSATWWVGTLPMLPFVFLGGLLIVRKIQREDMVFAFVSVSIGLALFFSLTGSGGIVDGMRGMLFYSPIWFFAFVMLTEPMSSPSTKNWQIIYAVLVGFLFSPHVHFGKIYFTPELALVLGNVFSYIVSPKQKLMLSLQEKVRISPDTYDYIFRLEQNLRFKPGQYLEWTLAHKHSDSRGNRRYFTIASAPTENELRIGVKFHKMSSSFKRKLYSLKPGDTIVASQLSGEFTLPKNPREKCVFIAGGIGITPFRSMLKYLIDQDEKRDIVVLFSNKSKDEIVYTDVFKEAYEKLGIKTIFTLTSESEADWQGERGRIDAQMIEKYVPDANKRTFYVSGTHSMVKGMEGMLAPFVSKKHIKTDFFPGFV